MDDKIEAVARALCRLDGKDPDLSTAMRGGVPGFHSFAAEPSGEPILLWTTYRREAERFVAAFEALQPTLGRVDIGRW